MVSVTRIFICLFVQFVLLFREELEMNFKHKHTHPHTHPHTHTHTHTHTPKTRMYFTILEKRF